METGSIISRNPTGAWMDSSAASFWKTSTQMKSSTRLPEKKELDTRINTHWGGKTKRTQDKCQFMMILRRQPHLLLRLNTRRDRNRPVLHRKAESDISRSTSSYVRNSDGNVKIGDKCTDRMRHHLQPRQPGRTPYNGKHDANGKNDKIGTDCRTGTNEFRFLDPPNHFENFFASQSMFFWGWFRIQTLANLVHATGKKTVTPHRTRMMHHRRIFFSCRAQWLIQCTCIGSRASRVKMSCICWSAWVSDVILSTSQSPLFAC